MCSTYAAIQKLRLRSVMGDIIGHSSELCCFRDTALGCDQTRLTQLLLRSRGATNQEKVGLKGIKLSE